MGLLHILAMSSRGRTENSAIDFQAIDLPLYRQVIMTCDVLDCGKYCIDS